MRIRVTAEDIAQGNTHACCSCPIALALRRQTGKVWYVSNLTAAYAIPEHREYPLPGVAQVFVQRFDARKLVDPFTFELAIQEVVL